MVALWIGGIGLIILVGALLFGKFSWSFGFDDVDWPVTRRDNPRGYWTGIVLMVAVVLVAGAIAAANHSIDIVIPSVKL